MALSFRDQQARNVRRTWWLILAFLVLFLATGASLGALFHPEPWQEGALAGLLGGAGVGLIAVLLAWWLGGDMVLAVSGAHRVTGREGLEERRLLNVVEEMTLASGLPMPKTYVIETAAPNAFACGRNEYVACVAVTRGLLRKLNRDELQAVVAHEMGHIRNRDILYTVMISVLIGTLVMLGDVAWRVVLYGGAGRGRSRSSGSGRDGQGNGAAYLVILLVAVILFLAGRILAPILFFAVSREREYLADATAVEFTRNPLALASALQKISGDPTPVPRATDGTAHLYFTNPRQQGEKRQAVSLLSTHPPIADRVHVLREMAGGYAGDDVSRAS